jgi:hypothetical protein
MDPVVRPSWLYATCRVPLSPSLLASGLGTSLCNDFPVDYAQLPARLMLPLSPRVELPAIVMLVTITSLVTQTTPALIPIMRLSKTVTKA